ncbi:MAG TPA: cupin [Candidatus Woesebacteria bacterium]|nr:cupin [Candidatus Woesebacteria bacterium]HPJ17086.1 cupin [Candidatus Woesebacteria bacterium]
MAIITKPWGQEIVLTENNLPYAGKILEINASHQLSLQYHDQKIETLTLVSGQAEITLDQQTKPMVINQSITIQPNTIHRIKAITNCQIFEVSTPETGTTFRLEDDYQRDNETDIIRNLPNRGWNQS